MPHTATITEDESGFAITCPECGDVGRANELRLAELLARFHDAAFELAQEAVR